MKKILTLLSILILYTGCASVHSGNYATQISTKESSNISTISEKTKETNLGLIISGELNKHMQSDYIDSINLSFENNTSDWIRIKNVKVYFEDEKLNENAKFLGGRDLLDWYSAIEDRNNVARINSELFWGTVAALGGVMSTFESDTAAVLGGVGALTGATSLTIKELNSNIDSILDKNYNRDINENKDGIEAEVNLFPKSHLFYERFNIPPGLYTRKWLAIHYPLKDMKKPTDIIIEYETIDGKTEKVMLPLRYKGKTISDPSQAPTDSVLGVQQ